MTLPFFTPDADPGPDFASLLRRQGRDPGTRIADPATHPLTITHGTTVVAVRTLIPSATGVLQAVWSLGIFSTSTRHMRQFAAIESFLW